MTDILRGTVERITYHNEENGYTVAQLMPEGQSYTVTVVGNMLGINVGESVAVERRLDCAPPVWSPVPGRQRAHRAAGDDRRPGEVPGQWLDQGRRPGHGASHRAQIRAGHADGDRGRTSPAARGARRRSQTGQDDHQGLGGTAPDQGSDALPAEPQRIDGAGGQDLQGYGDNAIAIVKSDPYRLAREIYGIGFITADKIARELGIAHDAPERVAAGVAYVLSQAADEGNVYLPAEELAKQAGELLEVTPEQAMQGIGTLAEAEEVRVEGVAPPGPAQPGLPLSLAGPLVMAKCRSTPPPCAGGRLRLPRQPKCRPTRSWPKSVPST